MYKNILLTADGTPASEDLIRFVCSLQCIMHSIINIVNVVEVPRSLPLNECPPDMLNEARGIIQAAEKIAGEYEAEVHTHIIFSRTTEDSIISTAEQLRCDTIAIAQSNQKLKLFASTPQNIYQRAKCSVWLINVR